MNERLFLTKEELADLTGFMRHGKQREWLAANGIPFRLNGHGRPIVTIVAITGMQEPTTPIKTTWEPSHGTQTLQKRQPASQNARQTARQ